MNKNEIQIGDIFVASWGYDQTNVDAYQCVRRTAKTAYFRGIRTAAVPGTSGFMCQNVVPLPNAFLEDGVDNLIKAPASGADGFKFHHGRRWATRHVDGKTYYQSWYA